MDNLSYFYAEPRQLFLEAECAGRTWFRISAAKPRPSRTGIRNGRQVYMPAGQSYEPGTVVLSASACALKILYTGKGRGLTSDGESIGLESFVRLEIHFTQSLLRASWVAAKR
jgi:hypothetical protein